MSTYRFQIPKRCALCDQGELGIIEDVALIRYDADTKTLLMHSPQDVEVIPAHVLACNYCGHLLLLSATRTEPIS